MKKAFMDTLSHSKIYPQQFNFSMIHLHLNIAELIFGLKIIVIARWPMNCESLCEFGIIWAIVIVMFEYNLVKTIDFIYNE